jgi:hypothetical protein
LVNGFLGFTQNSSESGLKPLASFQEGFVKVWEMFQPLGKEGLKFKREQCMHSLFSEEL